jgi:two-component system alkaline phosphatase synthesis response regulator PhoP
LPIVQIQHYLRRFDKKETSTAQASFKGVVIDTDRYKVLKEGVELKFAKKEFELLQLLFSAVGKVFTREDIMNTVWGTDVFIGDRTIDVHIRKLREKLGNDFIETMKGVGSRLKE